MVTHFSKRAGTGACPYDYFVVNYSRGIFMALRFVVHEHDASWKNDALEE
ncbi:MAG TPA: hypothetical protein VMX95_01540 [Thermodesulfobacteriota bacterium]|nr:hypothetical protein [Thermodesulfobacteriota bacterium]